MSKPLFVSEGNGPHLFLLETKSIPSPGDSLTLRPAEVLCMGPGGEALFFHEFEVIGFCERQECLCRRFPGSVPHALLKRTSITMLADLLPDQWLEMGSWQPKLERAKALLHAHAGQNRGCQAK